MFIYIMLKFNRFILYRSVANFCAGTKRLFISQNLICKFLE